MYYGPISTNCFLSLALSHNLRSHWSNLVFRIFSWRQILTPQLIQLAGNHWEIDECWEERPKSSLLSDVSHLEFSFHWIFSVGMSWDLLSSSLTHLSSDCWPLLSFDLICTLKFSHLLQELYLFWPLLWPTYEVFVQNFADLFFHPFYRLEIYRRQCFYSCLFCLCSCCYQSLFVPWHQVLFMS